ncbi:MAG: SRPBCC family protein [Actinomycetota bacterium]|nr:SRPBCC family protein [Actinomycetota bacterium]
MELTDRFELDVPVERAWAVLVDLERVAPCVPGAELHDVDGDDYRGVVRVRTGPLTTRYRGTASLVEKDQAARRIVLRAEGGDSRRHEKGSAVVTAHLREAGAGTEVQVVIDLSLAGRVAHMARGVVADVGAKLVGQFAGCLSAVVFAADGPAGGDEVVAAGAAVGPGAVGASRGRPAPPIDLLAVAGGSLARRALASVGARWLFGRRHHGHRR